MAGKTVPLLAEIVAQGTGGERRTLVTRSGHIDPDATIPDTIPSVGWNRRSALSARSVVLHAVNQLSRIDEAIIVYTPARDASALHEASIVSIEDRVDAEVKGYLFLLREILSQFQKQRSGRIALVVQGIVGEVASPLEATALGSFVSLAESLRTYYQNEPVTIESFISEVNAPVEYASFVIDTLNASPKPQRHSKWLRFPRRKSLLRIFT